MLTSLAEWVQLIQGFHCSTIAMGLDRVKLVAQRLNLTKFNPVTVKVAGTNGKGSTVAALEALALADGLHVATYTSPHLSCITERLQINGQAQSPLSWCKAFERVNQARAAIQLTFFEFTTLAVLSMIKSVEDQLDLIVLEIGLGGRLDAVNVVQTPFSIITKIALDHQVYLGNSRALIAKEKAGVADNAGLVVCTDCNPPKTLIDTLDSNQSTTYYINKDFFIKEEGKLYCFSSPRSSFDQLSLQLNPNNIAAALMMWDQLPIARGFSEKQRRALASLALPGRFDINPRLGIICDVAHNPDAVDFLLKQLKGLKHPEVRMIAVCAMLADKDLQQVITQSFSTFDEWLLPCINHDRAMSWTQIQSHAPWYDRRPMCIAQAVDIALNIRNSNDWIIVFGSFFTISETMSYITSL